MKLQGSLLAIDATIGRGSISLWSGAREVAVRIGDPSTPLSESILELIDEVCREGGQTLDGLERLAVSLGPGSYTGIRVGLATALGIRLTTGCQLIGIPMLNALAQSIPGKPRFVALGVGMGEFVVQSFGAEAVEEAAAYSSRTLVEVDELLDLSGVPVIVDQKTFDYITAKQPGSGLIENLRLASDNVSSLVAEAAMETTNIGQNDLTPIYAREFGVGGY